MVGRPGEQRERDGGRDDHDHTDHPEDQPMRVSTGLFGRRAGNRRRGRGCGWGGRRASGRQLPDQLDRIEPAADVLARDATHHQEGEQLVGRGQGAAAQPVRHGAAGQRLGYPVGASGHRARLRPRQVSAAVLMSV